MPGLLSSGQIDQALVVAAFYWLNDYDRGRSPHSPSRR
jgi:hypothetical protein